MNEQHTILTSIKKLHVPVRNNEKNRHTNPVKAKEDVSTSDETPEEEKKVRITKQMQDFVLYFTTKGHYVEVKGQKKSTYGVLTWATVKAYDLDPIKQYGSASVIGSENLKKLRRPGSMFADELDLSYEKMLQIGKAKMGEKGTKMWELMMDTLGYRDITPDTMIQNNTQNTTNIQVNEADAVDFNAKFKKFLESE
jgi:hypothetical protein